MLKYRPNINLIKSIRLEAYQMSTMKKRIPMFLLAIAMMVAMALPSFAATFQSNTARSIPTNHPYFLGCWNGGRDSNGDMHVLTGTGVNNITRTAVM